MGDMSQEGKKIGFREAVKSMLRHVNMPQTDTHSRVYKSSKLVIEAGPWDLSQECLTDRVL